MACIERAIRIQPEPPKQNPENESFPGHDSRPVRTCRPVDIPSSIQTLTVGLGIPPGHASLYGEVYGLSVQETLVGYTTDREFHPAPKVDIQLNKFYHQKAVVQQFNYWTPRNGIRKWVAPFRQDFPLNWDNPIEEMTPIKSGATHPLVYEIRPNCLPRSQ